MLRLEPPKSQSRKALLQEFLIEPYALLDQVKVDQSEVVNLMETSSMFEDRDGACYGEPRSLGGAPGPRFIDED